MDAELHRTRFDSFVSHAGSLLGYRTRTPVFASYLLGLMSALPRKTAEGIATLFAELADVDATYQRIQQFIADSPWKDEPLREMAAQYAVSSLSPADPVRYWIVDDTGFIKKGDHSVGVQRQYTGTTGKLDNCQLGVSLSLATKQRQLPIDFRLYLPVGWTSDQERRKEAKIPDSVVFKTKPELAAEMVTLATKQPLPRGIVLADCAYGNNQSFRRALTRAELDYSVDIQGSTAMWRADAGGRRRGRRTTAEAVSWRIKYERVTWTEGTKRQLSSRFGFARVVVRNDVDKTPKERARRAVRSVWLGVEWPFDEAENPSYFLSTLPSDTDPSDLVLTHKQRWRTERMYQDMKGALGLDHFEGRSYPGWNHHVTVALAAYAFAFAEQARLFPPEAPGTQRGRTICRPASEAFPGLDTHCCSALLWCTARMASTLSLLPQKARKPK